jgi:hypothetical protein
MVPVPISPLLSLDNCLAYVVLGDHANWLGTSSPTALKIFLDGAALRAELVSATISAWRIHGPLELPEFYLPIVARTGHPTLSITWPTALEFL